MGENSVVRVKMPSKGRGGSGGEREQEMVARTLGGVSGGGNEGGRGERRGGKRAYRVFPICTSTLP